MAIVNAHHITLDDAAGTAIGTTGNPIAVTPLPLDEQDRPLVQYKTGTASYEPACTPVVFKDIPATAMTAGTPGAIWTPATGKKFRLIGWCISLTVAGAIIFRRGAANTTFFRTGLRPAGESHETPGGFGNGFLCPTADEVLKLDVSASGTIQGFLFGLEE